MKLRMAGRPIPRPRTHLCTAIKTDRELHNAGIVTNAGMLWVPRQLRLLLHGVVLKVEVSLKMPALGQKV